MKKLGILLLAVVLLLAACSGGGMSKKEIADKLYEIDTWLVMDIWGDGFCLISHYTYDGTDTTGGQVDIGFAMEVFEEAMAKKPEYSTFIEELEGEEYDKLKSYWEKVSGEIDAMYKVYQDNPVEVNPDYPLETGLFTQYEDAFRDQLHAVREALTK